MAFAPLTATVAGRVFSITGGASGMGAATARLLAQSGAGAIHIADMNPANFEAITAELSAINPSTKVFTDKVDVSDSAQVEAWVDRIIERSGALHGAANVAGMPQKAFGGAQDQPSILSQTDEDWAKIMGVNLTGIMYCSRAQVRAMMAMPKDSRPAIVNVSSLAALLHGGRALAYGTSKAACSHFTASLAKDVYPFGIRVNAVLPGNTYTPMTKQFFGDVTKDKLVEQLSKVGIRGILDPSDIARSITWLLSEASADVNGVNLAVGEGAP